MLKFPALGQKNFILGIIAGALLTLLVNLATIQYSETLEKQRLLESIENEVAQNELLAANTIKDDQAKIKANSPVSSLTNATPYSDSAWSRGEVIKFVVGLDPKIQAKLTTFFTIRVPQANLLLQRYFDLVKDKLSTCYIDPGRLSSDESKRCQDYYQKLLNDEITVAAAVAKDGSAILQIFHPTQDRLNSFILRTLFGDKAVRFLSGN